MNPLRISAVSYLNTFPFVYGIKESGMMPEHRLMLDVPSVCADKLISGQADIALVPVGALPEIGHHRFISGYCVGAVGPVKTVLLLSKVPLEKIRRIYLDFDSRTSVKLIRVLARQYWSITPGWENLKEGQAVADHTIESMVAIGDKTFGIRQYYPYIYDLAEAWIEFTGLPFVFSAWVSKEEIPDHLLEPFVSALTFGVTHKAECLEYFRDRLPENQDCLRYLEENISFDFDAEKQRGLDLFLSYLNPAP